jgi:hypothetical protein
MVNAALSLSKPVSLAQSHMDDELERAFPNAEVSHLILIQAEGGLSLASDILDAVDGAGASLVALNIARSAGATEQRLRITGIQANEARLLSDRIAGLAGVEHTSVSHQIMRADRA